eukprot:1140165-Pelagomonas_calceolata.AAC.2
MCAPAKVMFQLLKCENVSKNVLCLSACACPNQDANTWRQKRARHEQTGVPKEVPSSDDTWLIRSCVHHGLPRHQHSIHLVACFSNQQQTAS